jgi:hypothetical protein
MPDDYFAFVIKGFCNCQQILAIKGLVKYSSNFGIALPHTKMCVICLFLIIYDYRKVVCNTFP